ncbi:DegT/DnrJ/EryC1/StrS family aminotransferase [Hyphomicrobium sp.]|jgi:perosamine synthetase|uniref:DegT/DnrJ/EryC1/StrS family aminotransferase n=1 Tax=Hyphomicrobium sp. TaxID=82 RepID=UPI003568A12C
MTERIPIAGPWITEKEVGCAADAAANGWYERAGYYVQRFEDAFANYLGVKHAIAVPHCTSAIHLALAALDIREGDEIIVPDITWIASAAPINYVRATPVFADIDPTTWCLSADSVRACVTERTKVIIPVGLYGLMPDMDALRKVADEYGLHIVEDAAQTIGARYKGRLAGTFGDVGVFSFHGTKTLTTGEGGMFVTDDSRLFERAQILRDHGRTKANFQNFYNTEVAFKYRMSSVQAALGCAQLERIEELVGRKRQLFGWYKERLSDIPGLQLNAEPDDYFNTFWMTTIVVNPDLGLNAQQLISALSENAIDTRPFFHPLSSLPAYSHLPRVAESKARNTTAYSISPRALNLPSAMKLTEAQIDRVCVVLRQLLV